MNPSLAKPFFDAAANVPQRGYENLLDELRRIFIGPNIVATPTNDGTSPASREQLYINIEDLKTKLSNGGIGQFAIDGLIGKDVATLARLAEDGSANGIAYRYAVKEGNSFAVLGTHTGSESIFC